LVLFLLEKMKKRDRALRIFSSFRGGYPQRPRVESPVHPRPKEEEEDDDPKLVVLVLKTQNDREKRKISKKTINYIRT